MSPSDGSRPGLGRHQGWFFLHPDAVPARWRERASPAVFVPLLPGEAEEILAGHSSAAERVGDEDALLKLVAHGVRTTEIADRLGLSPRTVQRRVAMLRRRYGATSKRDLGRLFAEWGFAVDEL